MKKIIAGKRYDTETAQRVAVSCSSAEPGDLGYWEEYLYKKRTGEFFLYGEGGPATKYCKQVALNSWSGGASISPLTYEEAKEWAEDNLSGDEFEEIFGPVDESMEAMTVTYSIPAAAADLVRREAEKTGRTRSDIVAGLILSALGPEQEA